MEPLILVIIALLVLVLVVFPIWAIVRIISLGNQNEAIAQQLAALDRELRELREKLASGKVERVDPNTLPARAAPTQASWAQVHPPVAAPEATRAAPPPAPAPLPPLAVVPPVAPLSPVAPLRPAEPPPIPTFHAAAPPPVVHAAAPEPAATPAPPHRPTIDWEQFMGAKLFAWLGGLAALFGVGFFLKYSFEHDWIPPELRAAAGFLFGLGLVVGGLKLDRVRYLAGAHTLIATGIVSLYAVTFACNSIYHFAFFNQLGSFAIMSLITATAFLLAVRLEGRVIAVLGILGGFLTPALLATGHDNPPGLFGYIALLDLGLLAVALHRRWNFLVALGAAGTVIMQLSWAGKFLEAAKAPTAMVVCLAFCALFFAAYLVARRLGRSAVSLTALPEQHGQADRATSNPVPPEFTWAALAFPFVAFGFGFTFLAYRTVAAEPGLLFSFVLVADCVLLAIAWLDEEMPQLHLAAGATVFALLAAWTAGRLTAPLLPWALAFYLLYAVLHTAFPLLLERHRPAAAPAWWSQLFPPLALLLMLLPLFKLDDISLLFWPCVLLVDALAIALALVTASLAAVAVVLVLTLLATGVWMFNLPASLVADPSLFLLVVGAFAVVFFVTGILLPRRLGARLKPSDTNATPVFGDVRGQLPAFSALLPFLLLIIMTQRLHPYSPSPIFGLALLLVVLTLGLASILVIEWLPACAIGGVVVLEYAWGGRFVAPELTGLTITWLVVFYAIFAAYPFLFRRRFAALRGPWIVAALSGVLHFPLVYDLIPRFWPDDVHGLLPALFAVAPLLSLVATLRAPPEDERLRLDRLAWFGGVALLFITLIFPIQFERQWITLGWALEGVALLWLFHRVPHPGLRATGAVLLVAAFVRLALNPAVLAYHPRADTPVFNWYLYSYGVVTACLFIGARLLAPPRERVLEINTPPLLNTLGTVLAFLLLNLEIADYFSPPGGHALTFQFSGNFARDMTYTIAWALFALGLLLVSMWKQLKAGRYAAIALLGAALLKLFFHDLAHLQALYRIGALFAVAAIATVASFAYQRFLPAHEKNPPSP